MISDKYISKKAINCAIQSLDIIKQDFEIFVRIDLDAIFFCNIEELVEYSVIHKIGFLGAKDYWSENKEYFHKPYYLNCGIAVFNKKYFNLKTDFQMFYNPEIHFCPEQLFELLDKPLDFCKYCNIPKLEITKCEKTEWILDEN